MNWAGESVRAVPLHLRRRDSDAANHHHDDSEAGVEVAGAKKLQNAFWDNALIDIYQQCRPDIMHSLAIRMDSHILSAIVYTVSESLRIETGDFKLDRTGRAKTVLPWTAIGSIWSSNARHVLRDYDEHNCGLVVGTTVG